MMENSTEPKQRRSLSWQGDKIYFMAVRDVKLPEYGTGESVGIDFFVPNDFTSITLEPGEDALIPSGIKTRLPIKTALIAFNKSGVATKKKFSKGAQVIDPDYQGEIHIHVFNIGKEPRIINPGDKIIQFIHLPIIKSKLVQCQTEEELFPAKTERGTGGFGSTGNDKTSKLVESAQTLTHDINDKSTVKFTVPIGKKSVKNAKKDLDEKINDFKQKVAINDKFVPVGSVEVIDWNLMDDSKSIKVTVPVDNKPGFFSRLFSSKK